mmetsp:Transcript_25211/g.41873  ORF Transcript_25211/g.41873 Transcript_25211/m.41873 type:complete len:491 (+) Transcript_25211:11-1483(+)
MREHIMGPVPLKGDLRKANTLLERFRTLKKRVLLSASSTDDESPEQQPLELLLTDLWETFAWNSSWSDRSRVLFAIPKTWSELQPLLAHKNDKTLTALKRQQHSVSIPYLEEHGTCGDWITVQPSTLPQAGRGAFARRPFETNDVVAPFPLIHLPYRDHLDMFDLFTKSGSFVANNSDDTQPPRTTQLLENYCMGHNESTMLLCPYGTLSSHINHNQTQQNIKLIWADPAKSNHQPQWLLHKSLSDLYQTDYAGLSMTLVATRPIAEGEELFLDYGNEWEQAWTAHVAQWTPVDGAAHYRSAEQLNAENATKILKTEFELMHAPWPGNVDLKMNLAFERPRRIWLKHWEQGTLQAFVTKEDDYNRRVEVLRREVDAENRTWYTVVILKDKTDDEKQEKKIRQVPREAFSFFDRPYTSDMHLDNAFRHDIRIPDHLFPQLWKNRVGGNVKQDEAATDSPKEDDDTRTTADVEPVETMESGPSSGTTTEDEL